MIGNIYQRTFLDPKEGVGDFASNSGSKFSVVQRGTDILTVVQTKALSESADAISAEASKQPGVPHHTPDGAGAILIFHSEKGNFVLGGLRDNPALAKEQTKAGTSFPKQINSTIGGYLAQPELPLRQSVMSSIRNKMFLNGTGQGLEIAESQKLLEELCRTIETDDGWEDKVCVHTDKWSNSDGTEGKMCFLTAIKHVRCFYSELAVIEHALSSIMARQREQGTASRALSEFRFAQLGPIIENSCASYLEDEITKASKAYELFNESVTVTFNDLAVATFAQNHAFDNAQYAHLSLSNC